MVHARRGAYGGYNVARTGTRAVATHGARPWRAGASAPVRLSRVSSRPFGRTCAAVTDHAARRRLPPPALAASRAP
eukprot:286479-Prymnesium_polylepis.1